MLADLWDFVLPLVLLPLLAFAAGIWEQGSGSKERVSEASGSRCGRRGMRQERGGGGVEVGTIQVKQ